MNVELGYRVTDRLTLAAKAEYAKDTFDWLPERRYGGCAHYLLHEGDMGTVGLRFEYLRSTFDDNDNSREDTVSCQMALDF